MKDLQNILQLNQNPTLNQGVKTTESIYEQVSEMPYRKSQEEFQGGLLRQGRELACRQI